MKKIMFIVLFFSMHAPAVYGMGIDIGPVGVGVGPLGAGVRIGPVGAGIGYEPSYYEPYYYRRYGWYRPDWDERWYWSYETPVEDKYVYHYPRYYKERNDALIQDDRSQIQRDIEYLQNQTRNRISEEEKNYIHSEITRLKRLRDSI